MHIRTLLKSKLLLLVLLALLGINLAVLCLQMISGDFPMTVGDAIKTVFGIGEGNSRYELVIHRFRLPRALVAFLVGAGLAVSGVILQGITRNPLAAPGVIGLNAGAALMAVLAIVLVPDLPVVWLPFVAFGGALLSAAVSYVLAWRQGLSPVRLVLVGVSISACAGAFVSFLLTFSSIRDAKKAMLWMSGSVYGRSWEHVWALLPWLAVLFPLCMLLAKQLDVIRLGDELAKGLGSRLERTRFILLLISVSLAGASVAVAGTIGFVGLMAPHMSRYLVGPSSRRLLPAAALLGGLLVMLADLLGRTLLKPSEIPCGIMIAFIGAPYMLYLLYTKRNLS
ncbi:FecCD family ABC transporter permease [Paenibacillus sp. y28]|uniref:FecCD family ABC transporter permease n=1 Tax=Paenibacillus sp. y28 TaxID=3129110 RepID=UPI00301A8F2E